VRSASFSLSSAKRIGRKGLAIIIARWSAQFWSVIQILPLEPALSTSNGTLHACDRRPCYSTLVKNTHEKTATNTLLSQIRRTGRNAVNSFQSAKIMENRPKPKNFLKLICDIIRQFAHISKILNFDRSNPFQSTLFFTLLGGPKLPSEGRSSTLPGAPACPAIHSAFNAKTPGRNRRRGNAWPQKHTTRISDCALHPVSRICACAPQSSLLYNLSSSRSARPPRRPVTP